MSGGVGVLNCHHLTLAKVIEVMLKSIKVDA